jgi:hypothetical protein
MTLQVDVYIHAKFPRRVASPWVRSRLIGRSFRPEWGSVDIVRAELELLAVALQSSPGAGRFAFASESCLPVVPAGNARDAFGGGGGDISWVCARSTPNNGYSSQLQFAPLERAGVPRELIGKADQWCLLTR